MFVYEIFVMTPNGAIAGTFDAKEEANDLYRFAKSMKYDIVCRKVDYDIAGAAKEKRFIEDESAFRSGIRPSIDGLKGIIFRLEMEDANPFHVYRKEIEGSTSLDELNKVYNRAREDKTLTESEKRQLMLLSAEKADTWLP